MKSKETGGSGGGDLDWFLFETRMRTLVREILEPVVEKNEQEAEKYLTIDKKINQIFKRLDITEYALNIEQRPPEMTIVQQVGEDGTVTEVQVPVETAQKVPNVFEQIFQKMNQMEQSRKKENLEVVDRCIHTETQLRQMNTVLSEEVKRMVSFGAHIERLEQLTMGIHDDLTKFKLLITEANQESRKLIIEEGKAINKIIAEMQKEKEDVDKQLLHDQHHIKHLEEMFEQAQKTQKSILAEVADIEKQKVQLHVYQEFVRNNEERMLDIEDINTKHDNNIKSLENYVEKYVPCNTQNLIIENLKQFVSRDIIARLKSQTNKVQAELTATMLADTGHGNILNNPNPPKLNFQFDGSQSIHSKNSAHQHAGSNHEGGGGAPGQTSAMGHLTLDRDYGSIDEHQPPGSAQKMGDSFKQSSPSKNNNRRNSPSKKEQAPAFEGAWDEDEVSVGSFQKNTELELLRQNERLTKVERKLADEIDQLKEFMNKSAKEQQFYIEALHQDLEVIEKKRVKRYKEEEAERAKLMEDMIRLYEKIKSQDGSHIEIEKKISIINDRVSRFKVMSERRPLSPPRASGCGDVISDYGDTLSITPGRLAPAGSNERPANNTTQIQETNQMRESQRLMTAGTINMDKRRKRKVFTTGRPSISQGIVVNSKLTHGNPDGASFASIQQIWQHQPLTGQNIGNTAHIEKAMKISSTPSAFKLAGIGIDSVKKQAHNNAATTAYNQVNIKNHMLHVQNDIAGLEVPGHRVIIGNSISQMSKDNHAIGPAKFSKSSNMQVTQSVAV